LLKGFLSTEDSNAPGNNALLDLVAALHWVKQNIAAFGGDPDKVTLMGQGHGAALVNILMISPIAKGTLHNSVALCVYAIISVAWIIFCRFLLVDLYFYASASD